MSKSLSLDNASLAFGRTSAGIVWCFLGALWHYLCTFSVCIYLILTFLTDGWGKFSQWFCPQELKFIYFLGKINTAHTLKKFFRKFSLFSPKSHLCPNLNLLLKISSIFAFSSLHSYLKVWYQNYVTSILLFVYILFTLSTSLPLKEVKKYQSQNYRTLMY